MGRFASLAILLVIPVPMLAGGKDKKPAREGEVVDADLGEFSKLVHKMIVPQVPRFFEDNSGWGATIPAVSGLPLPKLRTYIKVGDRLEMPHGLWKKFRIWIDDPQKDVQIQLRELRRIDGSAYRLKLDASALVHGDGEVKLWQKGLGTPAVNASADAVVNLQMDIDVKLTVVTKKFPPDLTIEPWIVASKLDLKEFHLKKIGSIISVSGEPAANLGNDLKGLLNDLIRQYEEQVTDMANQAIAEGLREGKGTLSAGSLLKAFGGK